MIPQEIGQCVSNVVRPRFGRMQVCEASSRGFANEEQCISLPWSGTAAPHPGISRRYFETENAQAVFGAHAPLRFAAVGETVVSVICGLASHQAFAAKASRHHNGRQGGRRARSQRRLLVGQSPAKETFPHRRAYDAEQQRDQNHPAG